MKLQGFTLVAMTAGFVSNSNSLHSLVKAKDTNGEQPTTSARSLTPLHERMEWRMRRNARRTEVPVSAGAVNAW